MLMPDWIIPLLMRAALVEGDNYETSKSIVNLWYYRDKGYLAYNDYQWESYSNEDCQPLVVSMILPEPGCYRIYAIAELGNDWDIAISLDGGSTYEIGNSSNSYYDGNYSVANNYDLPEIAKYQCLFNAGIVTTTTVNQEVLVYVDDPKGAGGDERTAFDGLAYEFICSGRLLDNLNQHPCLILTDERLNQLKQLSGADTDLQLYLQDAIAYADSIISSPSLTYSIVDDRLLATSRELLDRIYALGLAWRWTNDNKYAAAAIDNLLTVCEFPDWHYEHFLDTAEMTHGVAIGYDWFYNYLSSQQKAIILATIIDKGLKPGIGKYTGTLSTSHDWVNWKNNWNLVCNYGMIIGALSIADSSPEYIESILPMADKSLFLALPEYLPDGAWPEGPMYWEYATSYAVYGMASLETALGSDLGMADYFGYTADWVTQMIGNSDKYFNYGDSTGNGRVKKYPFNFWFGNKFDLPYIIANEHTKLASEFSWSSPRVMNVVYYQPDSEITEDDYPPLDSIYRGTVQTASFRSSWIDPDAGMYVAVKAGDNQFSHAHLDIGSFVLDSMGDRFISDLGSDNYSMYKYFHNPWRWSYYRCGSFSHNVITVNNENQDIYAAASLYDFETSSLGGSVKVDMTSAYSDYANSVIRHVVMEDNRESVTIYDSFAAKTDCVINWGITTPADIELLSSTSALLTIGSNYMIANINSPSDAEFTSYPAVEGLVQGMADGSDYQYSLAGINRLEISIAASTGENNISVSFEPLLKINRQPQPLVILSDENRLLEVNASSISTVHYQWYKSVDKSISTDDMPVGADSSTFLVEDVTKPASEIIFVDAGLDNTRINGASPVEGLNYETGNIAAGIWYYRDKGYLAYDDHLWESYAGEDCEPLIVSMVLPTPGRYMIYALAELTSLQDIAVSLDGGLTYEIGTNSNSYYEGAYSVTDNFDITFAAKYAGLFAAGTVTTTTDNQELQVYVDDPDSGTSGDQRTSFDGLAYEFEPDYVYYYCKITNDFGIPVFTNISEVSLEQHSAPTPNPAYFELVPGATSASSIAMLSVTGSDESGPVEYLFTEITGNPGGTSSGWQTSEYYMDSGLSPETEYAYTVTMRDGLGNTGTASPAAYATTWYDLCAKDLVGDDCSLNIADLQAFLSAWLEGNGVDGNLNLSLPQADYNNDYMINMIDFAELATYWLEVQ